MGVVYAIIPLDEELGSWLSEQGFPNVPSVRGRWPTPRELRGILSTLTGVRIDWYSDSNLDADLSTEDGLQTTLRISEYAGDDSPCQPYFSKGSQELVTRSVAALALATGPLVIYPDTGDGIQVLYDGHVIEDPEEQG
jgi:hypothetical protein